MDSLTKTGLLLKSISIVGIGLVILGANINAEDFLGLNVMLLAFVHSSTLSNPWFILSRKIVAWGTKCVIYVDQKQLGPKLLPWGNCESIGDNFRVYILMVYSLHIVVFQIKRGYKFVRNSSTDTIMFKFV